MYNVQKNIKLLFFIKISFFGLIFGLVIFSGASFFTHTAYALESSVTISAFVPEKTATTTFSFNSGGDFTFTAVDNTQVNFTLPDGFYSENLDLRIFQYDHTTFESQKPPPSGKSFVGKTYDFNFFTTTGGSISTLSSASTIVMHYLDSDVSGLNESTIKPYRRGANDSSWSLISGGTVDTTSNTITFATSTFSSFGILGAPACSDDVDNDGDGKTDYSADPGCSSTSDNDETDPAPESTPTLSSGGRGGGGANQSTSFIAVSSAVYNKIMEIFNNVINIFNDQGNRVQTGTSQGITKDIPEEILRDYIVSASPKLIAPEIISYVPLVPKGEELFIKGKTHYPEGKVLVFIATKKNNELIIGDVKPDNNGYFIFSHKLPDPESSLTAALFNIFKNVYVADIWTMAIDKNGNHSNVSEKVSISVDEPFLSLSLDINLILIIIFGVLSLLLLAYIMFNFYRQNRSRNT